MNSWFLKTIGLGEPILKNLERVEFSFRHPALFVVGLLLLIPLGVWIHRRQTAHLSAVAPWVLRALTGTRIVVLALLIWVVSGPHVKIDYERESKPVLGVLLDHSESMLLPAGPFEDGAELKRAARAAGYSDEEEALTPETRKALQRISRAHLAHTALRSGADTWWVPLQETYDVRFYGFGAGLEPLEVPGSVAGLPDPPVSGDSATHLGDACDRLLDEAGTVNVAGLLLISDGQSNGGSSPSAAAHRAASLGVPVVAVPVGIRRNLQDVSLVDLDASSLVCVGDSAHVAATIESRGLNGKEVTVRLLDGQKVLDEETLLLHDAEQQHVDLSFEASEDGARYLTVQIDPLAEEVDYLQDNNADLVVVNVTREKVRVLYVDGLPRWDFRYLKNTLRRDHGIGGLTGPTVDIALEAELRRRPPEEAEVLFPSDAGRLADYHAIVLGDVSPALLTPARLAALREAVEEKGVGLIVMAGPLYMPHAHAEGLKELLPVRLHPGAAGVEAPVYRPFRIDLTPEGGLHDILRLVDDEDQNRTLWSRFPPYYWCAAADRPAPGATVLAWNPSVGARRGALPLLALHQAGEARVLFVGTDSTWLWRQNAGERFFQRFWGQAVRFVAKLEGEDRPVSSLVVQPVRVQPGQSAMVELLAFAADGSPRRGRTAIVSMVRSAAGREQQMTTLELAADGAVDGRYTASFTPDLAGEYRIQYEPETGGEALETTVRVAPSKRELRFPGGNLAELEFLAQTTGGAVLALDELPGLADHLQGEPRLSRVRHQASIWDNWLTAVVLVGIYSLDVGLRRLRGLS